MVIKSRFSCVLFEQVTFLKFEESTSSIEHKNDQDGQSIQNRVAISREQQLYWRALYSYNKQGERIRP